jgi:hypothetical protein
MVRTRNEDAAVNDIEQQQTRETRLLQQRENSKYPKYCDITLYYLLIALKYITFGVFIVIIMLKGFKGDICKHSY